MSEVRLAQLILASLEKDQAPSGLSGFQTVCRTSALLSASEAEEVEARLGFVADPGAPPKRLYHVLSTGKVVLAQATPIPEADAHGRGGRYVAHAFVVPAEELAAEAITPLRLLERLPFETTLAGALGLGSALTGQVHSIALPTAPPADLDSAAPTGWSREALAQLTLLAARADEPAAERPTLGLVGEPPLVEEALRAIVRLLPLRSQFSCTFDTDFRAGNLAMTPYWAVGLREPSASPRVLSVDAATGLPDNGLTVAPETPFEHWAVEQTLAGEVWSSEEVEQAARLCAWMAGEDATPEGVPRRVIESVFGAAGAALDDLLRDALSEYLPPRLRERAMSDLRHWKDREGLLASLWGGLTDEDLRAILMAGYAKSGFRAPTAAEVRELRGLGGAVLGPELRLLLSSWSSAAPPPELRAHAERLCADPVTPSALRALLTRALARGETPRGWLSRFLGGRPGA